jgi:hypothetical protein
MDEAVIVMGWLRLALLLIASVYGVIAIKTLYAAKARNPVLHIKRKVFSFLAAAVVLFTLGIGVIQIVPLFSSIDFPSIADLPIMIAHVLFIIAFVYFWVRTAKLHTTNWRERTFFFATTCAVAIWLVFLIYGSVLPSIQGEYFLARILYITYPILVALAFLSTVIVNPRLKAAIISTPLWYISTALFLHFIAFSTQYYTVWHPMTYFIPGIYTFLYVLSAGFFVIGFHTITKKYE